MIFTDVEGHDDQARFTDHPEPDTVFGEGVCRSRWAYAIWKPQGHGLDAPAVCNVCRPTNLAQHRLPGSGWAGPGQGPVVTRALRWAEAKRSPPCCTVRGSSNLPSYSPRRRSLQGGRGGRSRDGFCPLPTPGLRHLIRISLAPATMVPGLGGATLPSAPSRVAPPCRGLGPRDRITVRPPTPGDRLEPRRAD